MIVVAPNAIRLALLLVVASCAKPTAAPVAAVETPLAASEPADPMAPRPFTADQLREAFAVGTRLRFRVDAAGQPPREERWEVTASNDAACTIRSVAHDPDTGAVIEAQGEASTPWAELVEHAAFPALLTTIEDALVTVPAGTFPTRRYTVRDLDGTVRVLDFAPALPGPPVQLTVTRDGRPVTTLTLLERS